MPLLVLGLFAFPGRVAADAISYDGLQVQIDGNFGTGTNQTMLVVDWNSGNIPSHAWLYSWSDPTTTMNQAFEDLRTLMPTTFQYNAIYGGTSSRYQLF